MLFTKGCRVSVRHVVTLLMLVTLVCVVRGHGRGTTSVPCRWWRAQEHATLGLTIDSTSDKAPPMITEISEGAVAKFNKLHPEKAWRCIGHGWSG